MVTTAGKATPPRVAYVPVIVGSSYRLGIAEKDVAGYSPISLESDLGGDYESYEHARATADECNKRLGLTPEEAFKIVASSMGASMRARES
jgi:hypothetical protein